MAVRFVMSEECTKRRNENIFLEREKEVEKLLAQQEEARNPQKKMQKPVFLLRCHPHFSSISHSVGRKDEYVCLSALAKCV